MVWWYFTEDVREKEAILALVQSSSWGQFHGCHVPIQRVRVSLSLYLSRMILMVKKIILESHFTIILYNSRNQLGGKK